MELREKIQSDLKEAIKTGDSQKLSVLRMVSAAVQNKQIEKRTKLSKAGDLAVADLEEESRLTDEEILEVLAHEMKKRKEAVSEYEKGNRQDLADKEKSEMEILKPYLPQELSDDELRLIVREAVKETAAQGQKDFGRVMSALMPKTKGRADGARVSRIVKEAIA